MRAGMLNRSIAIQTRSSAKDTFGQQIDTWTDLLTDLPAGISALTGRELVAAQAVNAEVTHEIEVRYLDSLAMPVQTAAMRAVFVTDAGTRYFEILAAMNTDERDREIRLLVSEGLTQG